MPFSHAFAHPFNEPISRGLAERSTVLRRAMASLPAPSLHKLRSFIFAKVLEDTTSESHQPATKSGASKRDVDISASVVVLQSPLASCHAFLQLCQSFFLSPIDAFRCASMDPALASYAQDVSAVGTSFATVSQEQVIHFFLRCIEGELSSTCSVPSSAEIIFPLSLECAILLCACIAYYQQSQCPVGTEGLELLRYVFAQCVETEAAEELRRQLASSTDDNSFLPSASPRSDGVKEFGAVKIRWSTLKQRLASFCSRSPSNQARSQHQQQHHNQQLVHEQVASELASVLSSALGTPIDAKAISLLRSRRKDSEDGGSLAASPARHRTDDDDLADRISFDEFLNHLKNDTFATGSERSRWRRQLQLGSPTKERAPNTLVSAVDQEPSSSSIAVFDVNERALNVDPLSDMLQQSNTGAGDDVYDDDLYEEDSFAAESSRSHSLASFTAVFEVTTPQHGNNTSGVAAGLPFHAGTSITSAPSAPILMTSPTLGTADATVPRTGSAIAIGRSGSGVSVSITAPSSQQRLPQQLDLGSSILGGGGTQVSAAFTPMAVTVDDSLPSGKKLQAAARRKSTRRSPLTAPLGLSATPLDHLRAKIETSVGKIPVIRAATDAKIEKCNRYVKKDLAVLDGHTGVVKVANSASIAENSRRQPRNTRAYAPSMTEREETKLQEILDDYNVEREVEVMALKRQADMRDRERRVLALTSKRLRQEKARHDFETSHANSLINHEDELVRSIAMCSVLAVRDKDKQRQRHNEAERKSAHVLQQLKARRGLQGEVSQLPSKNESMACDNDSSESSFTSMASSCSTDRSNTRRRRHHRPLPTPTPGPGESPKLRVARQHTHGRSSAPLNMSLSPERARTDGQLVKSSHQHQDRASSPSALPAGSYDLLIEADGVGIMRATVTFVFSFADLLEALDDVLEPFQHDLKKHAKTKRPSLRGAGRRETVMNLALGADRRRVSDVFLSVAADSIGVKVKYIPLGSLEELPRMAKVRVLFD